MSANQFKYTDDFRDQAVDLLLNSGKPLKQVARELGVNPSTLRSWRDRRIGTRSEGVAEVEGAETLEMKVKRLKRENPKIRREVCDDRFYAEDTQRSGTVRDHRGFTQQLLCIKAVDTK